jgi:hypothetical protein
MTRHAALNNLDHRDLRIDTRRGAALGDDLMFAPTFPAEFRNVQAYYPIVFHKNANGAFQPVALFGVRRDENLFLDGERWDASYLPLAVERAPFLIGASANGLDVHIDLDHPRVRRDAAGEALFREHGGTTPYLDRMSSVLRALHDGLQTVPAFIAALIEHGLLESFALDVELGGGEQHRMAGFYAIHEEKLRDLEATAIAALHRAGQLEAIYMALASLAHLRDLIERINRRVAGR